VAIISIQLGAAIAKTLFPPSDRRHNSAAIGIFSILMPRDLRPWRIRVTRAAWQTIAI